ncbi:MAG TPA: DUF1990 family protein [Amnibacterium sp.]|nr:DUF1990 family protein [Amnibacterium sp.]
MTGPRRRTAVHAPDTGLNYTAIGATASPEVVAFPPAGFTVVEARHRVGSGARRFDLAGRALMTWGALRAAGFDVEDIRAEPKAVSPRGTGPLFLEDGTPWITPGMTATITAPRPDEGCGPVKVITVVDEAGRTGYIYGSRPGHASCEERLLLLEHEEDDGVWFTVRSIRQGAGRGWGLGARAVETRQKRFDERLVKALHPSNVA